MRSVSKLIIVCALMVILAAGAWRSLNYISSHEPGPDSGVYIAAGWHASNGRVLYRDVWSHAPPGIFAINAVAVGGTESANAIRDVERVFALVGVAAFFATVYLGLGRLWIAFAASGLFLFHFYWIWVFEDGNVTEEFGAVFWTVGVAAAIGTRKIQKLRRKLWCSALAGLAFSAAVFFKEPFLLVVPPWFLYAAWPIRGDWRAAAGTCAAFLCGAASLGFAFASYLVATGAWPDWVDSVAFSLRYRATGLPAALEPEFWPHYGRLAIVATDKLLGTLFITSVAATCGVLSVLSWTFSRKHDMLPPTVVASVMLSLLAASLGSFFFGHYFLIAVPSFVMLAAIGLAFVFDVTATRRSLQTAALAGLVLILILDASTLRSWGARLAAPNVPWQGHSISAIVRAHSSSGDLVWAPWKNLIYAETETYSPTKWFFVYDHLFIDTPASTSQEKLDRLRSDLMSRPPRVIVVNAPAGRGRTRTDSQRFLASAGLTDWLRSNYRTVYGSSDEEFEILARKPSAH